MWSDALANAALEDVRRTRKEANAARAEAKKKETAAQRKANAEAKRKEAARAQRKAKQVQKQVQPPNPKDNPPPMKSSTPLMNPDMFDDAIMHMMAPTRDGEGEEEAEREGAEKRAWRGEQERGDTLMTRCA